MSENLFDDVHAWTFLKHKGIQQGVISHRMALRNARRFTMDATLDDAISKLASEHEDRLPAWLALARLPYDHVWIERTQIDELGYDSKMGTLMTKVPGSETKWIAHTFIKIDSPIEPTYDRGLMSLPFSFVVETSDESEMLLCPHYPPLHRQYPRLFLEEMEIMTWAVSSAMDGRKRLPKAIERPWYADNIYLTTEPTLGKLMFDGLEDRRSLDGFMEHMLPMMLNSWDAVKYAVIALATLNDVPFTTGAVEARSERRSVAGKNVPYLDYSVISLRVPAKRPDHWLRRRLDNSIIRKRAHEVRGHWRSYFDRSSGELKKKVWIKNHERGDASLGHVQHTYRVSGDLGQAGE